MPQKHVLIVDDDADCRELLTALMAEAGLGSEEADNGEAALERLRTMPTLPILILVDLMMPVMGGEVFREHQLEDPRLCAIPTAIVSASHDALRVGRRLGAEVLRKPIPIADLLALAHRALSAQRD